MRLKLLRAFACILASLSVPSALGQPVAPQPPKRTALYFQFGQSTAVGVAPVTQLPVSRDFSRTVPPIQEVQLLSGSGETARYRLRNLQYLRTPGDAVVDPIDGAIAGPRGETVIDFDTSSTVTAMSSFVGVADQIASGYNSSASKVILFKVARGGTTITSQDPYQVSFGGGVYKNGRRAMIKWLRGFVDGEVRARRLVDLQMIEFDQGEREAALARNNGNLQFPLQLAWPAIMRNNIYPYYVEKFGAQVPLLIRQLLPIRTSNEAAAPLDPYTAQQNTLEESVCRYTAIMGMDGSITRVVDNGASPLRIDNAYFLKHDKVGKNFAEIHPQYDLNMLFGKAKVNLQRYLEPGNQGLTRHSVVRIAPVIMTYKAEATSTISLAVDVFVDEASKLYLIAVPTGASAPGPSTMQTSGKLFNVAVDVNGNGYSQRFTIQALKPATRYDVYALAIDPIYGHAGSVFKTATGVATPGD